MKNKRSIIIIIVLLLMVIVSGTMAWLSYQSKKTALVLVLGDDDSFVITIDPYHVKGTLPSTLDYSQLSNYSFVTAVNYSSLPEDSFTFYYNVNQIDDELLGGSLKYAITKSTSLNGTYTEVASGTFNSSNTSGNYYVFEDSIPGNATYYYKSYIYIDGSTDNSALINKTVSIEFKASFRIPGVIKLINKANDSSITTYTDGNTKEMYTFSQPETAQLGATTDYRYIGSNPNNYILFNNEIWRIIGVFDGKIKIIKDTPIEDVMWDYKQPEVGSSELEVGSSDWTDSQIMFMLNSEEIEKYAKKKSGYSVLYNVGVIDSNYNLIAAKGLKPTYADGNVSDTFAIAPWRLNATSLSQVEDMTYYLGGLLVDESLFSNDESMMEFASTVTTPFTYSLERGNAKYNASRSLKWNGKVGLMYMSDYGYTFGYGVDDSCYNTPALCGSYAGNPSSSWLYDSNSQWGISSLFASNGFSASVLFINDSGSVFGSSPSEEQNARPVVYLKADTVLSGTGTKDENIYMIVNKNSSNINKVTPTNGAAMLINKANKSHITTYTDGNTKEMYTFSQPETEQTAATTEYRYIGNRPNNYIEFNNELWRIIGVFDGKIKIIKNTPIESIKFDRKSHGTGSSLSGLGSSYWGDSELMFMLNSSDISNISSLKNGYTYDGLYVRDSNNKIIYQKGCESGYSGESSYCTNALWSLNAIALSQVADATYYLGGNQFPYEENIYMDESSLLYYFLTQSALNSYQFERGNARFNNSRSLAWNGKVGLMYPSDYAYTFAYGIDNNCFYSPFITCNFIFGSSPSLSWLYSSNNVEWTITPFFIDILNEFSSVVYVLNSLEMPVSTSDYYLNARPVVYLKPDVELTGNGTNDENIYKIVGSSGSDSDSSGSGGTLSDVIRIEAESGSGNAAKYTGLDSDTYENDVYYFKGSATNTNVLFANHCWQMIRTTDTGGVKLLYNGTPTDGKCNNTGTASQLPSTKKFNTSSSSPAYVGYMYNKVYTYSSTSTIADDNIYGNSFTYANGTYTLSGSTTTGAWSSIYNKLSNTHYTCLNNTGTCDAIKYIYYTNSSKMYYITLTGGKSVNDALNEMLWADDVNENDSVIKDYIDTWYASNMTNYTSYFEDTVYCNDRSVYNLNGWNPNGGSTSSYLYFYTYHKKDLTCTNKNDRFTMSSTLGNGKLTYPVGLMTAGEAYLIGSTLSVTGEAYKLGSPYYIDASSAGGHVVNTSGNLGGSGVSVAGGVRPVVSLKPGTEYVDGEGSGDEPFLVE